MGVEQQPVVSKEEAVRLHTESGNLKFLEHINLSNVDACTEQAPAFVYFMRGLQCSRDPRLGYHFWANFGRNQFHLFTGQPKNEQVNAVTVLYAPDLDDIERSLESVRQKLQHTKFQFSRVNRGGPTTADYPREKWHEIFDLDAFDHLRTSDPYGNDIRVYVTPKDYWPIYQALGKLLPETEGHPAKLQGLPFVYHPVRPGIARGIARFFEHYIGAKTTVIDKPDGLVRTSVWCGPLQAMVFDELEAERDNKGEYDGHHVCFHIDQFKEKYDLAFNEQMNWNNTLFFDRCDTWEQANRDQQYRILNIVDPVDKSFLMAFEMEIRSAQHFRYLIHRDDVTDEEEAANEVLRKKNL